MSANGGGGTGTSSASSPRSRIGVPGTLYELDGHFYERIGYRGSAHVFRETGGNNEMFRYSDRRKKAPNPFNGRRVELTSLPADEKKRVLGPHGCGERMDSLQGTDVDFMRELQERGTPKRAVGMESANTPSNNRTGRSMTPRGAQVRKSPRKPDRSLPGEPGYKGGTVQGRDGSTPGLKKKNSKKTLTAGGGSCFRLNLGVGQGAAPPRLGFSPRETSSGGGKRSSSADSGNTTPPKQRRPSQASGDERFTTVVDLSGSGGGAAVRLTQPPAPSQPPVRATAINTSSPVRDVSMSGTREYHDALQNMHSSSEQEAGKDWYATDGDEISYIAGSNGSLGAINKVVDIPLESSVSTDDGMKQCSGGLDFKQEVLAEARAAGRAEGRAESETLMKESLKIYRDDYAATVSGLEAAHQQEVASVAAKFASRTSELRNERTTITQEKDAEISTLRAELDELRRLRDAVIEAPETTTNTPSASPSAGAVPPAPAADEEVSCKSEEGGGSPSARTPDEEVISGRFSSSDSDSSPSHPAGKLAPPSQANEPDPAVSSPLGATRGERKAVRSVSTPPGKESPRLVAKRAALEKKEADIVQRERELAERARRESDRIRNLSRGLEARELALREQAEAVETSKKDMQEKLNGEERVLRELEKKIKERESKEEERIRGLSKEVEKRSKEIDTRARAVDSSRAKADEQLEEELTRVLAAKRDVEGTLIKTRSNFARAERMLKESENSNLRALEKRDAILQETLRERDAAVQRAEEAANAEVKRLLETKTRRGVIDPGQLEGLPEGVRDILVHALKKSDRSGKGQKGRGAGRRRGRRSEPSSPSDPSSDSATSPSDSASSNSSAVSGVESRGRKRERWHKVRAKKKKEKAQGSGGKEKADAYSTPSKAKVEPEAGAGSTGGRAPAGLEISPQKQALLEQIGRMMDQRDQRLSKIEHQTALLESRFVDQGGAADPDQTADFGGGHHLDAWTSRDRRREDRGLQTIGPRTRRSVAGDEDGPGAARGPPRATVDAKLHEPESNIDKLQLTIDGLNSDLRGIRDGELPAESKAVQERSMRKVVQQLKAIRDFNFFTGGRDTNRFIRGVGGSATKAKEGPTHAAKGVSAVGQACNDTKNYQNSDAVNAFRYYGRRDGLTQEIVEDAKESCVPDALPVRWPSEVSLLSRVAGKAKSQAVGSYIEDKGISSLTVTPPKLEHTAKSATADPISYMNALDKRLGYYACHGFRPLLLDHLTLSAPEAQSARDNLIEQGQEFEAGQEMCFWVQFEWNYYDACKMQYQNILIQLHRMRYIPLDTELGCAPVAAGQWAEEQLKIIQRLKQYKYQGPSPRYGTREFRGIVNSSGVFSSGWMDNYVTQSTYREEITGEINGQPAEDSDEEYVITLDNVIEHCLSKHKKIVKLGHQHAFRPKRTARQQAGGRARYNAFEDGWCWTDNCSTMDCGCGRDHGQQLRVLDIASDGEGEQTDGSDLVCEVCPDGDWIQENIDRQQLAVADAIKGRALGKGQGAGVPKGGPKYGPGGKGGKKGNGKHISKGSGKRENGKGMNNAGKENRLRGKGGKGQPTWRPICDMQHHTRFHTAADLIGGAALAAGVGKMMTRSCEECGIRHQGILVTINGVETWICPGVLLKIRKRLVKEALPVGVQCKRRTEPSAPSGLVAKIAAHARLGKEAIQKFLDEERNGEVKQSLKETAHYDLVLQLAEAASKLTNEPAVNRCISQYLAAVDYDSIDETHEDYFWMLEGMAHGNFDGAYTALENEDYPELDRISEAYFAGSTDPQEYEYWSVTAWDEYWRVEGDGLPYQSCKTEDFELPSYSPSPAVDSGGGAAVPKAKGIITSGMSSKPESEFSSFQQRRYGVCDVFGRANPLSSSELQDLVNPDLKVVAAEMQCGAVVKSSGRGIVSSMIEIPQGAGCEMEEAPYRMMRSAEDVPLIRMPSEDELRSIRASCGLEPLQVLSLLRQGRSVDEIRERGFTLTPRRIDREPSIVGSDGSEIEENTLRSESPGARTPEEELSGWLSSDQSSSDSEGDPSHPMAKLPLPTRGVLASTPPAGVREEQLEISFLLWKRVVSAEKQVRRLRNHVQKGLSRALREKPVDLLVSDTAGKRVKELSGSISRDFINRDTPTMGNLIGGFPIVEFSDIVPVYIDGIIDGIISWDGFFVHTDHDAGNGIKGRHHVFFEGVESESRTPGWLACCSRSETEGWDNFCYRGHVYHRLNSGVPAVQGWVRKVVLLHRGVMRGHTVRNRRLSGVGILSSICDREDGPGAKYDYHDVGEERLEELEWSFRDRADWNAALHDIDGVADRFTFGAHDYQLAGEVSPVWKRCVPLKHGWNNAAGHDCDHRTEDMKAPWATFDLFEAEGAAHEVRTGEAETPFDLFGDEDDDGGDYPPRVRSVSREVAWKPNTEPPAGTEVHGSNEPEHSGRGVNERQEPVYRKFAGRDAGRNFYEIDSSAKPSIVVLARGSEQTAQEMSESGSFIGLFLECLLMVSLIVGTWWWFGQYGCLVLLYNFLSSGHWRQRRASRWQQKHRKAGILYEGLLDVHTWCWSCLALSYNFKVFALYWGFDFYARLAELVCSLFVRKRCGRRGWCSVVEVADKRLATRNRVKRNANGQVGANNYLVYHDLGGFVDTAVLERNGYDVEISKLSHGHGRKISPRSNTREKGGVTFTEELQRCILGPTRRFLIHDLGTCDEGGDPEEACRPTKELLNAYLDAVEKSLDELGKTRGRSIAAEFSIIFTMGMVRNDEYERSWVNRISRAVGSERAWGDLFVKDTILKNMYFVGVDQRGTGVAGTTGEKSQDYFKRVSDAVTYTMGFLGEYLLGSIGLSLDQGLRVLRNPDFGFIKYDLGKMPECKYVGVWRHTQQKAVLLLRSEGDCELRIDGGISREDLRTILDGEEPRSDSVAGGLINTCIDSAGDSAIAMELRRRSHYEKPEIIEASERTAELLYQERVGAETLWWWQRAIRELRRKLWRWSFRFRHALASFLRDDDCVPGRYRKTVPGEYDSEQLRRLGKEALMQLAVSPSGEVIQVQQDCLSNRIYIGVPSPSGPAPVTQVLLDSGCTTGRIPSGQVLGNIYFLAVFQIPYKRIKEYKEKVFFGTPGANACVESLKYCTVQLMFGGHARSSDGGLQFSPIGDGTGFRIPDCPVPGGNRELAVEQEFFECANSGCRVTNLLGSDRVQRGVNVMVVHWLFEHDSLIIGHSTMARMGYSMGHSGSQADHLGAYLLQNLYSLSHRAVIPTYVLRAPIRHRNEDYMRLFRQFVGKEGQAASRARLAEIAEELSVDERAPTRHCQIASSFVFEHEAGREERTPSFGTPNKEDETSRQMFCSYRNYSMNPEDDDFPIGGLAVGADEFQRQTETEELRRAEFDLDPFLRYHGVLDVGTLGDTESDDEDSADENSTDSGDRNNYLRVGYFAEEQETGALRTSGTVMVDKHKLFSDDELEDDVAEGGKAINFRKTSSTGKSRLLLTDKQVSAAKRWSRDRKSIDRLQSKVRRKSPSAWGWKLIALCCSLVFATLVSFVEIVDAADVEVNVFGVPDRAPGAALTREQTRVAVHNLLREDMELYEGIAQGDMSKGFSQYELSAKLERVTGWVYKCITRSPLRLFLGVKWAPQLFCAGSQMTFGGLRDPGLPAGEFEAGEEIFEDGVLEREAARLGDKYGHDHLLGGENDLFTKYCDGGEGVDCDHVYAARQGKHFDDETAVLSDIAEEEFFSECRRLRTETGKDHGSCPNFVAEPDLSRRQRPMTKEEKILFVLGEGPPGFISNCLAKLRGACAKGDRAFQWVRSNATQCCSRVYVGLSSCAEELGFDGCSEFFLASNPFLDLPRDDPTGERGAAEAQLKERIKGILRSTPGEEHLIPYVDDVNFTFQGLWCLLTRCSWVAVRSTQTGMVMSLKKFKVGRVVEALGWTLDFPRRCRIPSRDKVSAIRAYSWEMVTRNPRALKRFLCKMNYLREAFLEYDEEYLKSFLLDKKRFKLLKDDMKAKECFCRIRRAVSDSVELCTIDLEGARNWRTKPSSENPILRCLLDSCRIRANVYGLQYQRGKQRMFIAATRKFSREHQERIGASSIMMEITGLLFFARVIVPRLPWVGIVVYHDNTVLTSSQLWSLCASVTTIRSLVAMSSEILAIFSEREIYMVPVNGSGHTLADTGSKMDSGEKPDAGATFEQLKKNLVDLFGVGKIREEDIKKEASALGTNKEKGGGEKGDEVDENDDEEYKVEPGSSSGTKEQHLSLRRPADVGLRRIYNLLHYASVWSIPKVSLPTSEVVVVKVTVDDFRERRDGQLYTADIAFPSVDSVTVRPVYPTVTKLQAMQGILYDVVSHRDIAVTPQFRLTELLTGKRYDLKGQVRVEVVGSSKRYNNTTGDVDVSELCGGVCDSPILQGRTIEEVKDEIKHRLQKGRDKVGEDEFFEATLEKLEKELAEWPIAGRLILLRLLLILRHGFWMEGREFPTCLLGKAYHPIRADAKFSGFRKIVLEPVLDFVLRFHLVEHLLEGLCTVYDIGMGIPTQLSALFLAVRKLSGLGRLIVDATALNQLFEDAVWPLAEIGEIYRKLTSEIRAVTREQYLSLIRAEESLAADQHEATSGVDLRAATGPTSAEVKKLMENKDIGNLPVLAQEGPVTIRYYRYTDLPESGKDGDSVFLKISPYKALPQPLKNGKPPQKVTPAYGQRWVSLHYTGEWKAFPRMQRLFKRADPLWDVHPRKPCEYIVYEVLPATEKEFMVLVNRDGGVEITMNAHRSGNVRLGQPGPAFRCPQCVCTERVPGQYSVFSCGVLSGGVDLGQPAPAGPSGGSSSSNSGPAHAAQPNAAGTGESKRGRGAAASKAPVKTGTAKTKAKPGAAENGKGKGAEPKKKQEERLLPCDDDEDGVVCGPAGPPFGGGGSLGVPDLDDELWDLDGVGLGGAPAQPDGLGVDPYGLGLGPYDDPYGQDLPSLEEDHGIDMDGGGVINGEQLGDDEDGFENVVEDSAEAGSILLANKRYDSKLVKLGLRRIASSSVVAIVEEEKSEVIYEEGSTEFTILTRVLYHRFPRDFVFTPKRVVVRDFRDTEAENHLIPYPAGTSRALQFREDGLTIRLGSLFRFVTLGGNIFVDDPFLYAFFQNDRYYTVSPRMCPQIRAAIEEGQRKELPEVFAVIDAKSRGLSEATVHNHVRDTLREYGRKHGERQIREACANARRFVLQFGFLLVCRQLDQRWYIWLPVVVLGEVWYRGNNYKSTSPCRAVLDKEHDDRYHIQHGGLYEIVLWLGYFNDTLLRECVGIVCRCLTCMNAKLKLELGGPPRGERYPVVDGEDAGPGSVLVIDFVTGLPMSNEGKTCIFTANDAVSGMLWTYAGDSATAAFAVECVLLIFTLGDEFYSVIRCDNGSHFRTLFETLLETALKEEYTDPDIPAVKRGPNYGARAQHETEGPHKVANRSYRVALFGEVGFKRVVDAESGVESDKLDEEVKVTDTPYEGNWSHYVSSIRRDMITRPFPELEGASLLHLHRGRGLALNGVRPAFSSGHLQDALSHGAELKAVRETAGMHRHNKREWRNINDRKIYFQQSRAQTDWARRGAMVLRILPSKTKLQTYYIKQIFVISVVFTNAVSLQRLDGHVYYGGNPIVVSHLREIKLTRAAVHGYFVDAGMSETEIQMRFRELEEMEVEYLEDISMRVSRLFGRFSAARRDGEWELIDVGTYNVDGFRAACNRGWKLHLMSQLLSACDTTHLQEIKSQQRDVKRVTRSLQLIAGKPEDQNQVSVQACTTRPGNYGVACSTVNKMLNLQPAYTHKTTTDFDPSLEGRITVVEEASDVLSVGIYQVNSGTDLRRFSTREAWTTSVKGFLKEAQKVYRIIVFTGDFNALAGPEAAGKATLYRDEEDRRIPSLSAEEQLFFAQMRQDLGFRVLPITHSSDGSERTFRISGVEPSGWLSLTYSLLWNADDVEIRSAEISGNSNYSRFNKQQRRADSKWIRNKVQMIKDLNHGASKTELREVIENEKRRTPTLGPQLATFEDASRTGKQTKENPSVYLLHTQHDHCALRTRFYYRLKPNTIKRVGNKVENYNFISSSRAGADKQDKAIMTSSRTFPGCGINQLQNKEIQQELKQELQQLHSHNFRNSFMIQRGY